MGQITAYKQTLIQTATKVETLSDEMKSVHVKLREYDKSIQSYSDMCDDITASNSQTDSQIESLIQKVNTLEQCQNVLETKQSDTEEKLIDVQWRTMRENLVQRSHAKTSWIPDRSTIYKPATIELSTQQRRSTTTTTTTTGTIQATASVATAENW